MPLRHMLHVLLICLAALCSAALAQAHETRPAVADLTIGAAQVTLIVTLPLEPVLAGVDLGSVTDTNDSPRAAEHDALRALPAAALEDRMRAAWPALGRLFRLESGGSVLPLAVVGVTVPEGIPRDLPRDGRLTLVADLPTGGAPVSFSVAPMLGPLILRQTGEGGYTGYLTGGVSTPPLERAGRAGLHGLGSYVVAGYRHIVPLGVDHILFVLGLFFYSSRLRPLLLQVTAFTLAHTVTLGLATFGIFDLPRALVEPLIAASIVWIAVENIRQRGVVTSAAKTRVRLVVVTGFGLLHGLGFAAMLAQLGLPEGARLAALAAFNIGVELGQLAVIAAAFVTVGLWFRARPWYTAWIARPASALIGLAGAYWLMTALL